MLKARTPQIFAITSMIILAFGCITSRKDDDRYTQIKDLELCEESIKSETGCSRPYVTQIRRPSGFEIKVSYEGYDPEDHIKVSLLKNDAPFASGRLLPEKSSQGISYSRFEFDQPLIPGPYFVSLSLSGTEIKLIGQTGTSIYIEARSAPARVALCSEQETGKPCQVDLASVVEGSPLYGSIFHDDIGEQEFVRMVITEDINPFDPDKGSKKIYGSTEWSPVQKVNSAAFAIPAKLKKGAYSIQLQYREDPTFEVDYTTRKRFKVYSEN